MNLRSQQYQRHFKPFRRPCQAPKCFPNPDFLRKLPKPKQPKKRRKSRRFFCVYIYPLSLVGGIEDADVALDIFSSFDTGKHPSRTEPERFYHGFVLGLMVDLSDRYVLTSNRESGFGRYDIMLEPKNNDDNAYIIEFKVHKPKKEPTLEDTVATALTQIEDKKYDTLLIEKGVPADKIYKYGFAFQGKTVLIG